MGSIERRVEALERREEKTGQLPTVVDDETTDEEMEALRREHGFVMRLSDAADYFV